MNHIISWDNNDYQQWIKNGCHVNNKVKKLYLSKNNLTTLSEFISNLINLEELYCDNNQITKLPKTLYNLINLKIFQCSNNQLTNLHKSICKLVNLRGLYCSNNELTKLPITLGNLIDLNTLFCSNNRLTELPKSFSNLINLLLFDCSNNQLIELPNSIIKLKQIVYISYDKNIKLSVNLQRYINIILNKIKNIIIGNINVHKISIQTSLLDSINNLLSETTKQKQILIIDDNILDSKTKTILYNFIEDKIVGDLLVTFEELLVYILEKIEN